MSRMKTLGIVLLVAAGLLASLGFIFLCRAPATLLERLIKDPEHRARVSVRLEESKNLEARGVRFLATALQEIHDSLYRWEPYHDDDRSRIASLKMMFEVWAKMPAPIEECPGRGPGGHQDCSGARKP